MLPTENRFLLPVSAQGSQNKIIARGRRNVNGERHRKDAKKAPEMYKLLNITKEDFEYNQEYVKNILSGNVSVTE